MAIAAAAIAAVSTRRMVAVSFPACTPAAENRAVSASLQFGPWGPAGYFDGLRGLRPRAVLPDYTIAVYDVAEMGRAADGQ